MPTPKAVRLSANFLNAQRVLRAAQTLVTYKKLANTDGPIESLGDLLADLMHYCDQHEIDFADRLRVATMHHDCEKRGEL